MTRIRTPVETAPAQPDPPGATIIPFPGLTRHCVKVELPETTINFPFSKAECDIFNAHLCARASWICANIPNSQVRDVVERIMKWVLTQS